MVLMLMMVEYMKIKEEYSDCILFYRLGDFYEMFFEDVIIVLREFELVFIGKNCGFEERVFMCGILYYVVVVYILRFINKGYKVVICEQFEDLKVVKGIVKRGVVKIVILGIYIDSNSNLENDNIYLMVIYEVDDKISFVIFDISIGEFKIILFDNIKISFFDEILKVLFKEILIDVNMNDFIIEDIKGVSLVFIFKKDFNDFLVFKDEFINQFFEIEVVGLNIFCEFVSRVLLKYIYEI